MSIATKKRLARLGYTVKHAANGRYTLVNGAHQYQPTNERELLIFVSLQERK